MKRFVDVVQYLVLAGTVVFLLALFVNEPATPEVDGATPAADTPAADAPAGDTPDTDTPTETADGASVYADNCASCHGADGAGGFGPALGDGAVVEAIPDAADQVVVITDGRNGMPAFGGELTPEEIQAVTDYTRNDL